MSTLLLVRHGKASAFSPQGYDQLSPPGFEQARLLGEYWAARKQAFDRVFVGPRKRHAQTLEEVATVYRAHGLPLPEPEPLEGLDEHHGMQLLFAMLPELGRDDAQLQEIAAILSRGEKPDPRDVLSVFRRVMRRYAAGELDHPDIESWRLFRARVEEAVETMTSALPRNAIAVAFTSAGAVGAAVGHALGVDDLRVLDLGFSLYNGSISELTVRDGRASVVTFNGTPHLADPALVTAV